MYLECYEPCVYAGSSCPAVTLLSLSRLLPRVPGIFPGMISAFKGCNQSESLKQLFQLQIKSLCQRVQGVNSGGNGSILDLAEVCSPDSSHVRKLGLRQAMLFP